MHKVGKVSVSSFSKEYFFLFSDSKLNIITFGVKKKRHIIQNSMVHRYKSQEHLF